jgi:DNA polymerase V
MDGKKTFTIAGRVFPFEPGEPLFLPLASARVSAGFPSPAEDYIESSIDLNRELIRHPFATFYVRVAGDSMTGIGIKPDATLIVDRAVETKSGDIVIARLGDEMCVKELFISEEGRIFLVPKNDNYRSIEVTEDMDFEIWGKVIWSINRH